MPIHPRVAATLPLLADITSFEDLMTEPELRERFEQFNASLVPSPPPAAVRSAELPGPHGPIPVRSYSPPADDGPAAFAAPALIWLHGGAFRFGDLDMPEADAVAREIAVRAGAVVVSVDYRLAVAGVRHPVPHDDVVAAVRWVRDGTADLGVDPARICVGGASAGANLAAGATIKLRDEDGWQPMALLVAYPVAHPVLPEPSPELAVRLSEVPPILRFLPDQVHEITENYLGGPPETADGYAMPALAPLTGLAPTLVLNAEYDDLRSSGEAFTAALAVAGVDVQQVVAPGMLHGFLNLTADLEPVETALSLMAQAVAGCRQPTR